VSEEHVLVVERRVLERAGVFQGLSFDVQRYVREFFVAGVPRFIPRARAEEDPGYKQIIPYVILTCQGKCLSYVRGRRAGEARLVGLRSIGIGGHINPADDLPLFDGDFREAYENAVQREVAEELLVETDHTDRLVAAINDDSTDVGRVHFGLVHCWELIAPRVAKREQMITRMEFLSPAELTALADEMESWSRLCVENLAEIVARAGAPPRCGAA